MPIYVSAALVLHRRNEIFSVEAEMPVLHHLLNHIPKTVDIEAVLERARHLFREYKPNMIQGRYYSYVIQTVFRPIFLGLRGDVQS
jgi:hypothetical protein